MLKNYLSEQRYKFLYRQARKAFNNTDGKRLFLEPALFSSFYEEYKHIPAEPYQDYSIPGLEKLASEHFNFLTNKTKNIPETVLEIGAGSGFVLKKFKEAGSKRAISVDIIDMLYKQVYDAGVELCLTTAENMAPIADNSVDLIYTWGSLEHIPNPKAVFDESIRILKPGGYFYLSCGPLYYSPWGYHHHSILRCPYLHLLFPDYLIHKLAFEKRGKDYQGYLPWTNGLELKYYTDLTKNLAPDLVLESYNLGYDWYSARMISKYPDVFKSKNVPFENFFVDGVHFGIFKKPLSF